MTEPLSTPQLDEQGSKPDEEQEAQPQKLEKDESDKVTALLVLNDARRMRLARTSVNQFMLQTYENKDIVIVNSSGQKVTTRDHPLVKEIEVDPTQYPTVGSLRNVALENATGDWVLPWDDDDHSHPHRLVFQMAHRRGGSCVVLTHQLRVDIRHTIVYVHRDPDGVPGTILFQRSTDPLWLHKWTEDASIRQEDTELLKQFASSRVVVNNHMGMKPGPALHMAYHHGLNVRSREEFFGEFAADKYKGGTNCHGVDQETLDYIQGALAAHNLRVESTKTQEPDVTGSLTHE